MKPKVYVETTIVSYLIGWPSRDVVIAGHQQITREWWEAASERFEFVTSELVIVEASAGDPQAARERLEALESLTLLEATDEALALARQQSSGQKYVRYPSRPISAREVTSKSE